MPAVVDLVERLAAVHDCDVVALRYPPARPHTGSPGRGSGRSVSARSGGPVGRAVVLARGVRAVLAIDRRRRIDVVHGLWADEAGAVAAIAGRLLRRPVVVSLMGGELVALADIGYGAASGPGRALDDGRLAAGSGPRDRRVRGGSPVGARTAPRARPRCSPRWASTSRCSGPTSSPGRRARPTGRRWLRTPSDRRRSCSSAASNRSRTLPSRYASSRRWPAIDPDCGSMSSARGACAATWSDSPGELGVGDRISFLGQVPRAEMPARYARRACCW